MRDMVMGMNIGKVATALLAAAFLAAGLLDATPAVASDGCAAMSHLVKVARNDFTALRSLKMQPGVCTLRASEYKCRWAFSGDAFGAAEAQANAMAQCAAVEADAGSQKLKRGGTLVALEPDLALVLAQPEIDSGQWVVVLRIVAGPAAALIPGR